jgi:hypothetical protein
MPDEYRRFIPDPPQRSAELEFIMAQLAKLPTRGEMWCAAMLGMIGGAVAAVTLIEAFFAACR